VKWRTYLFAAFLSMEIALAGCGPTPAPEKTASSAGDTWTRPEDGAVMIYVPAGEFLMGSTDDDPDAIGDEKPRHAVYLDAFWIDKTEVTNAQYRQCVEAGGCDEPDCWDDNDYNAPDQPVVCVTWDDAGAYAAWVGGRLPTEAEWEKAARGTDGRVYPWGDSAPDCETTNHADCTGRPGAVGSYPAGASPYGGLDVAGNVWEWVADWYDDGYYERSPLRNPPGPDSGIFRVLRGGSYNINGWGVRCAVRLWDMPDAAYRNYGFRVAGPGPSSP
jgi:formylglycine-generating enzyme required for sulfatase activity